MRRTFFSYLTVILFLILALTPRNILTSIITYPFNIPCFVTISSLFILSLIRGTIVFRLTTTRDYRSWIFATANREEGSLAPWIETSGLNEELVTGRVTTQTGLPEVNMSYLLFFLITRIAIYLTPSLYEFLEVFTVDSQGVRYVRAYISSITELLISIVFTLAGNAIVFRLATVFVRNPREPSTSQIWVYDPQDNHSIAFIHNWAQRVPNFSVYDLHRITALSVLETLIQFDYNNVSNVIFLCPINLWRSANFNTSYRALYFNKTRVSEQNSQVEERNLRARLPRGNQFELLISTETHSQELLFNIIFYELFPYNITRV